MIQTDPSNVTAGIALPAALLKRVHAPQCHLCLIFWFDDRSAAPAALVALPRQGGSIFPERYKKQQQKKTRKTLQKRNKLNKSKEVENDGGGEGEKIGVFLN